MTYSVLRHTDLSSIEAQWGLRKIVVQTEEIHSEGGTELSGATLVTTAAVIRNRFAGEPVTAELQSRVRDIAPRLAKLLTDRILSEVGGAEFVEAFGKAAIVGVGGELEHGAALIHTPYYANLLREFLDGTTVIPFADLRGAAGVTLTVPLGRKDAGPTRDHFQTINIRISDAPRADEIVIIAAASTGTRPFPRSGDRTTDPIVSASQLMEVYQ